MNQKLQQLLDSIQQSAHLDAGEKNALSKKVKEIDKEVEITLFKLDRTEKVKRTTAILLEETIEELEQKRKAVEAQNRELEIESSLERVRTVAMSMNKRDDMLIVCKTISEQLELLKVEEIRNVQTAIFYEDKSTYMNYEYYAKHNKTFVTETTYTNHEIHKAFADKMLSGNGEFFVTHITGDEVKPWVDYQKTTNVFIDDYLYTAASLNYYWYSLGPVALGISTYSPLPDEAANLFRRFLKVFELSYRRYLDIEKAEAQAREATIEAALEKIRSRSLAMHRSEELKEVMGVMFQKLTDLNVLQGTVAIQEFNAVTKDSIFWIGNNLQEPAMVKLPYDEKIMREDNYMRDCWEAKDKGAGFFNKVYSREQKDTYFRYVFTNNGLDVVPQAVRDFIMNAESHLNCLLMEKNSALFADSWENQSYSEEKIDVLKRTGRVFEQAYVRFLDLQKAEEQAREAKIEAAMEKVRSRAMAMQKPGELVEVAELLRKEMNGLGVEELETSSIYIHHEDTQKTDCWYAIKDVAHAEKELVSDHMTIQLDETWVGRQMLAFCRSGQKQVSIIMQGASRKEWINYCAGRSKVLVGFYEDDIPDRTYHLYKFSNGFMGAASPGDISAESWDLLQRTTSVFSLAYTRFSDLQQAEAQAREAQIEVALERVRSRTLAMQKSDELAETAAVLFRQLISLGIEPNRLYITIIKDESGDMEFWITDEDATKVGNKFSGNAYRNSSFQKMYEGWAAQKKSITIDMQGDELTAYFNHLNSLGIPFKLGLAQKRRIQNIAYFGKGFIGMASPDEQPEETISLLERFAAVFNLTYTRFNDLQVAEAHAMQAGEDLIKLQTEKKRAEVALAELRETQKQLIQSEKMASLGELTAGIAHEIQNPLNFVNNFSEVSNELIEELKAERNKAEGERDKKLEDELLHDLEQNLEKINHHGKRADGIVKGMLQHSRTSTSQKESTDINKLADEYLRLAYHGLRAKDKSFNATLKTDFDETIGNINIIPQDIGRVVLNIMTNAFYAVNAKKKMNISGYEPAVSVQTKKIKDKAEISITDNGGGIPKNIIDKIFQPFFTTKPTGQGTGLGLSLAYDIVKAHGGELKVMTKEEEGSEFIIQLPII